MQKLFATVSILALAACAAQQDAIQESRTKKIATTSPFARALALRYRDYAYELKESGQSEFATRFAKKSLAAGRDENVMPEQPNNWKLRHNVTPAMWDARRELLDKVNQGVIARQPQMAADAVFLYDCWIVQEVNWQGNYLETCRNEFFETLNQISLMGMGGGSPNYAPTRAYTTPAVTQHALPDMPFQKKAKPVAASDNAEPLGAGDYTVYFDFNSSQLDAAGKRVISGVAKGAKGKEITVGGHTDTMGSAGYNLSLSRDRAESVRRALGDKGLSDAHIQIFGYGESDPAVQTPDETREQKNRRAEVLVK